MKLLVFGSREDELAFFECSNLKYKLDITFSKNFLKPDNAEMTKGFEAIWILTNCRIDDAMAKTLADNGVKYIVSRAAGYDHINLEALEKYGLKAANVPYYSPNAISEHTVMLALMLLRKMKREMRMIEGQVFTLDGLRGRELRNMTVGVFGAGRIGGETIKILHGFGCKVLVYSLEMREEIKQYAQLVSVDTLLAQSDILIFHCGLSDDTYHIINEATVPTLKDGVCLINTARGELFDFCAVLNGLKSGKISALGMDVYENESAFVRKDFSGKQLDNPVLAELLAMENVIFTAHMSFFTDTAVANMIETSLQNASEFANTGSCQNELK